MYQVLLWPTALLLIAVGHGVLMLQVMMLMSLCETYYVVESVFGKQQACSQAMTMHVVS